MTLPGAAPLTVRALAGDAEADTYFALAAAAFPGYLRTHCAPAPGGSLATGWRRFVDEAPGRVPGQIRGAFRAGALVGGYLHEERWLRVGGDPGTGWRPAPSGASRASEGAAGAPLRSGYVGAVVTHPAHRGQGVGSALMRDAVALAASRRQALLVLRGIPDFYHRFAYADAMEVTEHAVERERVLALPDPGWRIRPAGLADAAPLLSLYERHYAGYTGGYARSLAHQEHLLRHRTSPPTIALDPTTGEPRGYLLLPGIAGPAPVAAAVEAAADTWPATLALLRHHAARAPEARELRWPLPPDSATYYQLADHLPLRSETRSRPDAGLMARPGHLGALCDGLLPLWRLRWSGVRCAWTGALSIEVPQTGGGDGHGPGAGEPEWWVHLELRPGELRRLDAPARGTRAVRLGPAALTRLVFGYRPVGRLSRARVPADLVEPLGVLFPAGSAWYAASNRC
jgi:GNAT superfamily N-acetyltransferase